jgi:hypothetical protein
MPSRKPDVVKINSPSDVVCALPRMFGFVPTESVVTVCTHGPRGRFGLVLRFDLGLAAEPEAFAEAIDVRARFEKAEGVFVVIFTDALPVDGVLPHGEFVDRVTERLDELVLDVLLVAGQRWWSYRCNDLRCCDPDGTVVDLQSPGATAVAAAYALAEQGVLPDRQAVVRSLAYDGQDTAAMDELIGSALDRHVLESQPIRQLAVRALIDRLIVEAADPRANVSDDDAAELAALCHDVIVRDEVLIRARKRRRRKVLLRVLRHVVRRIPSPFDAPICATLAWVAYASGDGAVANVALDRVLATDPDYSLALLIIDALQRHVRPSVLEEVMRGAAGDLPGRRAAG